MNKYYLSVKQPENKFPFIEIQIRDKPEDGFSGYLSAVARYVYEDKTLAFYIRPNIQFSGQFSIDEAELVSDWWRIAAQAVKKLEAIIKTKEDFKRGIVAREIGKSLVINFADDEKNG